mmetsp:Transcript_37713/g.89203  ORF Transcript_37713/g.89203 Transcript_37713/m.89203 type:complete len:266 (+) Transcript_37713:278-1075(+)
MMFLPYTSPAAPSCIIWAAVASTAASSPLSPPRSSTGRGLETSMSIWSCEVSAGGSHLMMSAPSSHASLTRGCVTATSVSIAYLSLASGLAHLNARGSTSSGMLYLVHSARRCATFWMHCRWHSIPPGASSGSFNRLQMTPVASSRTASSTMFGFCMSQNACGGAVVPYTFATSQRTTRAGTLAQPAAIAAGKSSRAWPMVSWIASGLAAQSVFRTVGMSSMPGRKRPSLKMPWSIATLRHLQSTALNSLLALALLFRMFVTDIV